MYPKVDFFTGIFLIIFSVVGDYLSAQLPPAVKGLGAGDYPQVILRILLILGVIQTGYAFYHMKKKTHAYASKYEKGELRQIFILVVCVASYIWFVRYLGFIILTPFFMFTMMYIFGLRKWLKMTIISIATMVIIYFIFNNLLYVILPRFNLY